MFNSDIGVNAEREAYFSKNRPDSIETHLIICVHGLDGMYIELLNIFIIIMINLK